MGLPREVNWPTRCTGLTRGAAVGFNSDRHTRVALAADAAVTRGDAYGKCTLIFKSPLHAQLAFDTLAGPAEVDTSGRPQKKIYLDDGEGSGKRPYCKVRPF